MTSINYQQERISYHKSLYQKFFNLPLSTFIHKTIIKIDHCTKYLYVVLRSEFKTYIIVKLIHSLLRI